MQAASNWVAQICKPDSPNLWVLVIFIPPFRYDGGPIVERSIQLGEPVIYVSMNYRYDIKYHYICSTSSDTTYLI